MTGSSEDEDDYMNMVIAEPTQIIQETSIQRAARKKKEGEARARIKSKQEREEDEAAAREAALAKSLDSSNKGFKMMAKLGYKPGSALGKTADARTVPINPVLKEDRGGIGHDAEKKRKFREEAEQEAKKVKVEQVGYRDRMRMEREEKRLQSQILAAQKVTERLDVEAETNQDEASREVSDKVAVDQRPLRSINVLWRGLVRFRREKDAERRMKAELQTSLSSKLPSYDDADEDDEDQLAYSRKRTHAEYVDDLDEVDKELEEFNELDVADRLELVVKYLRTRYFYCFWCKFQYPDAQMDGCPGFTEEDHD
ncbi:hypothetical protein BLS_007099 [Venturia inaequalis]|uniref:G-patch domain-containing protein n=1 Tax=Venturia inaequalis TaxID=5025 RepID=A0A8H3Z5U2_VENIN|nr:hypothetical protein BLS_007099 [Venturia inaequalis]RDI89625.1 hypothetical protein Vi05172_g882 [Venturia inaequalis]